MTIEQLDALDCDFAGWLRSRMGNRTCSQIAWRVGLDKSTVARLLSGRARPSLRTAVALIRLLEPR